MKAETKFESTLCQIIIWGSSLGGAVGAAALQAFRPPMLFVFSAYTVVAFFLGFGIFLAFWKLFFAERKDTRTKFLYYAVTVILIASGLAGVVYPMRFVAKENLRELIIGFVLAVGALSGVAMMLVFCKRFLDEDERKNSEIKPTEIEPVIPK